MKQIFRQKSKPIVAFSFIGLIIVFQLMVFAIGYNVPVGFLIILGLFCAVIAWGMLDVKCIIEGEKLITKVGPFTQRIPIQSISHIDKKRFRKAGSRKATEKLILIYSGKKKLDVEMQAPQDFINALQQINPSIKIVN